MQWALTRDWETMRGKWWRATGTQWSFCKNGDKKVFEISTEELAWHKIKRERGQIEKNLAVLGEIEANITCREYKELYGGAQNLECGHQRKEILWGKLLGEGYGNIFLWCRWYFLILNTKLNALFSIVQTVWENGPSKLDILVSLSCSQNTSSSLAICDICKIVIVTCGDNVAL